MTIKSEQEAGRIRGSEGGWGEVMISTAARISTMSCEQGDLGVTEEDE